MIHNTFQQLHENNDNIQHYDAMQRHDVSSERALWQSVVMQAVLDATTIPKDVKGRIERRKTELWFSMNNEDFLLICSFAELDPNFIIRGVRHTVQRNKKISKRRGGKNLRHIRKLSRHTKLQNIVV